MSIKYEVYEKLHEEEIAWTNLFIFKNNWKAGHSFSITKKDQNKICIRLDQAASEQKGEFRHGDK